MKDIETIKIYESDLNSVLLEGDTDWCWECKSKSKCMSPECDPCPGHEIRHPRASVENSLNEFLDALWKAGYKLTKVTCRKD